TPPPRKWGLRIEPERARPVPFCRQGLIPPPDTSPLFLVFLVPCR
ncbi:11245_t:CDS:1, partial [Ambispora gerdemannii]